MPAKYVVVAELKMGVTKNNSEYPYILDQDKIRWNLFPPLPKVELNKCYVFHYEEEGGYSNVKSIEPVVNVFKREALKDMVNRNDILRNLTVSMSYAKDLVTSGVIDLPDMFIWADKIHTELNIQADKLMPKNEVD